jgi:hypothetical protein
MSTATASGGKTLLAPTPYALKMALLDVACRYLEVQEAEKHWEDIRDLKVALLPRRAVVKNLFQKVLRRVATRSLWMNPKRDFSENDRIPGIRAPGGHNGPALGWRDGNAPGLQTCFRRLVIWVSGGFMQMTKCPTM